MLHEHKAALKQIELKADTLRWLIEELKEEHENWMNDHEYDWEETKSGQLASDNDYSLDEMRDAIQEICDKIEEIKERRLTDYE